MSGRDAKIVKIIKHKWKNSEQDYFFFVLLEDGIYSWQPLDYLKRHEPQMTNKYIKDHRGEFQI